MAMIPVTYETRGTWHGTCRASCMSTGDAPVTPDRRCRMSNFFNNSDTMRSLVGIFAAVVMGGTFIVAAAGPAFAADAGSQVKVSAESNIVHG